MTPSYTAASLVLSTASAIAPLSQLEALLRACISMGTSRSGTQPRWFHFPRFDARLVCEHLQSRPHRCAEGRNAREAAHCRQEQNSFRCDRCASACRRRCCSLPQAGSVMSVLHDTVATYDATAKLKVDSTNTSKPRRRSSLSVIYVPFRSFAGDVCLWDLRSSPKSRVDMMSS